MEELSKNARILISDSLASIYWAFNIDTLASNSNRFMAWPRRNSSILFWGSLSRRALVSITHKLPRLFPSVVTSGAPA